MHHNNGLSIPNYLLRFIAVRASNAIYSAALLIVYFARLTASFYDLPSVIGFFLFIIFVSQIISGVMISFSLIPEPMLIPTVREEEDMELLFIDDFFWVHERGVDLAFLSIYAHLFRKLYLNIVNYEHEVAWKSGVFVFLIFQVVVFLGLILCGTHLSEITLTIAANVMHTFFFFYGKFYWWIFTDKQLNSDTLIRLSYAHYLSAFYIFYIAVFHGIDIHYDWKTENVFDGLAIELLWWNEAMTGELGAMSEIIVALWVVSHFLYGELEAVSYELFMWGDIGLVPDIRFYGVAPHWYFRPFMAWLIVCPHHNTGIFGLVFFMFILFYQINIHSTSTVTHFLKKAVWLWYLSEQIIINDKPLNSESKLYYYQIYYIFLISMFYTSSMLPYGKFYNRLGGNDGLLFAYLFSLCYLTFNSTRKLILFDLFNTLLLRKALSSIRGNQLLLSTWKSEYKIWAVKKLLRFSWQFGLVIYPAEKVLRTFQRIVDTICRLSLFLLTLILLITGALVLLVLFMCVWIGYDDLI